MAHQDDEFFCIPQIRSDIESNIDVLIIYLTNGDGAKALPEERNRETLTVLTDLEVNSDSVVFLGTDLSISDGQLYLNMNRAFNGLKNIIQDKTISSVYFPCYEGGHQDHDAISWLVSKLITTETVNCFQFPLYNGYNICSPLFRVMKVMDTQKKSKISFKFNFLDLKYLLAYKSQKKTWLGLSPFILFRLLLSSKISLVTFEDCYLSNKPHKGKVLYERRTNVTYNAFIESVVLFRKAK
ncbi:PIG-L family deacetylase [Vibrio sp. 10N.261.51.F11]|uniref:PIG-L family deacetylase n=1 Tax=Vibrio sp. 10N.261.51.F11 TaxID=3229678 RepID=UPI0035514F24